VLDLFAGSGAVGLEALSRRAAEVWFVENDPRAMEVLRANVAAVITPGSGVAGVARLFRDSVATFANGAGPDVPFDLVFADPPYGLGEDDLAGVLALVAEPRWTAVGAAVVVERATRGPGPSWPPRIEAVASKRYGEGTLWYGRIA
jgi:16S rRNA (guanine966-N2)-methyltransferase